MQTALYLRISQDHTGEQRSIQGQTEDCRALAEQLGWTVYDEYRDKDVSATKRDRVTKKSIPRPQYERMLADIKAGKVGAIIAWHTDRLYRTTRDLDPLIDILEEHGVEIRTVQSGQFDLSTSTGRMIARILASVAQGEVEHKADRWTRSVRLRREAGHMQRLGGAVDRAFGWTPDRELVDEEAETVRWLAARIMAGASLRGLCVELADRGVKTVKGRDWQPQALRAYMLRPRLAGYASLNGEVMGKGDWPPVLDETTWQTVRSLLTARSRSAIIRVALLAGMTYCGLCKKPMSTGAYGRAENRIRTYRCFTNPGRANCGRMTVVAEPVEEVIEAYAKRRLADPRVRDGIAKAQSGGQTHILAELDAQQRRLDEIKLSIADPAGEDVELLKGAAGIVRERIESLDARLSVAAPARIPTDVVLDWPTDLGERRRLVELVVARVWVDPAKVRGGRFDPERVRWDRTKIT